MWAFAVQCETMHGVMPASSACIIMNPPRVLHFHYPCRGKASGLPSSFLKKSVSVSATTPALSSSYQWTIYILAKEPLKVVLLANIAL